MLIDIRKILKSQNLSGAVIHCGAHLAEENNLYRSLNLEPRYWVEAQSALCEILESRLKSDQDNVIRGAIWEFDGENLELIITNNSQSSSLLELGTHKETYPEVVEVNREFCPTVTLKTIVDKIVGPIALINLDIQGTELHALRGAGNSLNRVGMIYSEVNFGEVYKGCGQISELDRLLKGFGFRRVLTFRVQSADWGDALYCRPDSLGIKSRLLVLGMRIEIWVKRFMDLVLSKVRR